MLKEKLIEEYNINNDELRRDYLSNPILKHKIPADMPYKEDLEYLYIEKNIPHDILSKEYFNVSGTLLDSWIEKLKVNKPSSCRMKNTKKTCLEKYGVDNPYKNKKVQAKYKKTCLEKYGVDNPSKADEIKIKKIITEKQNNSFGKSKLEDKIYILLKNKYDIVERQYFDKNKYPWKCDFYIPKLDLYIEFQGHWSHGDPSYDSHEPFDENNEKHQFALNMWKKLFKEQENNGKKSRYKDAIYTWTIRDPLKRKTAKDNGLNWIEFFSFNDFNIWYKNNY